jgi:hypothetical protein
MSLLTTSGRGGGRRDIGLTRCSSRPDPLTDRTDRKLFDVEYGRRPRPELVYTSLEEPEPRD